MSEKDPNRKKRPKERIDELLLKRGLVETVEKARALVMAGDVRAAGVPVTKAGECVDADIEIELKEKKRSFVSRGGDKLAPALIHFQINAAGITALDLGASTGGFTDCLLQRGAKLVYAVDVGKNQLDFRLREDERVRVFEETHANSLPSLAFDVKPALATVDLSFIGLRQVLSAVTPVMAQGATILTLVKPQFELPSELIEKGGVVRKVEHQRLAINQVKEYGIGLGLDYVGEFAATVRGAKKGNQEFFLCFRCQ